ncbi:hypothetical protein ALC60_08734 [Trachymyrmex zeteki]|uniref:Uncharacterized protein n=1 Tax=Mycetomoellerius zeteki TaxID=64791 RepID=A0A151WW81_9HYME|nr:hypothetical protein ALC60_08734 [Trachymyrmex zeteki]
MSTKDTRRQDRLRYRSSRVTSLNLRSYNSNKPPSHMASSGGKHRRYPRDEPSACSYLAVPSQSRELAGKGGGSSKGGNYPPRLAFLQPNKYNVAAAL